MPLTGEQRSQKRTVLNALRITKAADEVVAPLLAAVDAAQTAVDTAKADVVTAWAAVDAELDQYLPAELQGE